MSVRSPVVAVVALPRLASEVHAQRALGSSEGARGVVVDETAPGDGAFVLRAVMTLVDASEDARALGVRPGMRILDAQLHAPSLAIDVVPRGRIDDELKVIAEVLLSCAPVVQPFAPATWSGLPMAAIALDLTGLGAIERVLVEVQRACARLGHRAVVASSPGTRLSFALARALARSPRAPAKETLAVKPADVERVLARLPLDALGLSKDLAASLGALGARTAGDVRLLLPKGGVERLGGEARAVLDVVNARYAPLRGLVPPERLVEGLDLDHPLTDVEPLVFVLSTLCNRLCLRARGRGQRVAEVRLSLERRGLNRGETVVVAVAFPDAILDDKAMLRSLQVRLDRTSLGGPVDKVVLEATRLARRAPRQLALEAGAAAGVRAEDALAGLLAEMAAEIGVERVGCLVVTDEPLPERMTRLAWPAPPPPPRPPAPERRRPRQTERVPEDAVTSGGRFLAGWPWPLRLLPQPVRLGQELAVMARAPLGILEGEDRDDRPYARVYQLLSFVDGRRALGLHDEESEETWLHGWFD